MEEENSNNPSDVEYNHEEELEEEIEDFLG